MPVTAYHLNNAPSYFIFFNICPLLQIYAFKWKKKIKKSSNIKSLLKMKLLEHLIYRVLTSLKLGYKASPSVSSFLVYSFTVLRGEETNRSSTLNNIAQFRSWKHRDLCGRPVFWWPTWLVNAFWCEQISGESAGVCNLLELQEFVALNLAPREGHWAALLSSDTYFVLLQKKWH